jgi:hypothetical protein
MTEVRIGSLLFQVSEVRPGALMVQPARMCPVLFADDFDEDAVREFAFDQVNHAIFD